MEEYSIEGITGLDINIQDNQLLLDTFLAGHSSVLALLDDECAVPKATDLTFLEKLNETLKKESFYHKPKSTSLGKFGIYHYAGEARLCYNIIYLLLVNFIYYKGNLLC